MAMFYGALEIKTPDGGGSGRFRVCGTSDESPSLFEECCDCPDGHESEQAANACPQVVRRFERIFPAVKTACPRCGCQL